MTENLYGYDLIYNPFYAMGTVEATIYNRVRAQLLAMGVTNFTDPYYGDPNNSPRTDDRQAERWYDMSICKQETFQAPRIQWLQFG